jgi:hypothetical protein
LKTKRIALKLGIAFTVLIALLAGIAQFGLRRMQAIDETFFDVTGRKLVALQVARRALKLSDDNSRIVMEIVLVENRPLVNTLSAIRSENSNEITRLLRRANTTVNPRKRSSCSPR